MSSERSLIGFVFVTGLVLLVAALSLLRGAQERGVAFAAEARAAPRPVADEAATAAVDLVLPGASTAAEPDPLSASASAPDVATDPEPELAPSNTSMPSLDQAPPPLPTACLVSGTVVDGATGRPCEAELWLSIPGAPSTNLVLQAPGGAFEQRLETPGRYALLARCDGKVGVLRDIPVIPGGRTEDLVVTLREAARVRVTSVGEADGEGGASVPWTCTLYQEGTPIGLIVGAAEAELAVPPGALTARLLVPGTGRRQERTVTAIPGELTAIRFD